MPIIVRYLSPARNLIAVIVVTTAINYFSSFSMVGASYLLPGKYSYPLFCAIMAILLLTLSLLWIDHFYRNSYGILMMGTCIAFLIPHFIFFKKSETIEDYFIFGFPLGIIVFVLFLLLTIKNRIFHVLYLRKSLKIVFFMYLLAVFILFSATLLEADEEYLRFIRQQIYLLLPMGGIAATILLAITHLRK